MRNTLIRLLVLGRLLKLKRVRPGEHLLDEAGSFLTDENGNRLIG